MWLQSPTYRSSAFPATRAPACDTRYSAGRVAHILFSIGISADEEVAGLVARMEGRGFATRDLSSIEAAQVCSARLRSCCSHCAGVRARPPTVLTCWRSSALGVWRRPTIHVVRQVHLRHLVGGRARSFTGELPDERIFQVTPGHKTWLLLRSQCMSRTCRT
jgi:hypothetical protein